jgi:hypothetical protein
MYILTVGIPDDKKDKIKITLKEYGTMCIHLAETSRDWLLWTLCASEVCLS